MQNGFWVIFLYIESIFVSEQQLDMDEACEMDEWLWHVKQFTKWEVKNN